MAIQKVKLSDNNVDYTKTINDNFSELDTNKVSTEAGKGLSTNDFTNNLKTKLENISEGAEVNTIESIKLNGTALIPDGDKSVNLVIPKNPEYTIAVSTTTEGYSKSYELQKDGVATGVKIDIPKDLVINSGSVEEVTNADSPYSGAKVGDKYIDIVLNDSSASHIYIPVNDLVDAYTSGNGININDSNEVSVKIYSTNSNGLKATANGLELDVATTTSGGAMSASDKTKLEGISEGAQVNKIENISVNGTNQSISDKTINLTIPTALFKSVKVAETTISAGTTEDTLEIAAGTNISLTPDVNNKKIIINATVPEGGTSLSTISFSSTDNGWGTVDSNGNYTLTIENSGNPFAVAKTSSSGGYESVMANLRADGQYIYVTADSKFSGMIIYY